MAAINGQSLWGERDGSGSCWPGAPGGMEGNIGDGLQNEHDGGYCIAASFAQDIVSVNALQVDHAEIERRPRENGGQHDGLTIRRVNANADSWAADWTWHATGLLAMDPGLNVARARALREEEARRQDRERLRNLFPHAVGPEVQYRTRRLYSSVDFTGMMRAEPTTVSTSSVAPMLRAGDLARMGNELRRIERVESTGIVVSPHAVPHESVTSNEFASAPNLDENSRFDSPVWRNSPIRYTNPGPQLGGAYRRNRR